MTILDAVLLWISISLFLIGMWSSATPREEDSTDAASLWEAAPVETNKTTNERGLA